jgi:hypothetical protein
MPLLAAHARTALLSTPLATFFITGERRPPTRRAASWKGANAFRSAAAFFLLTSIS